MPMTPEKIYKCKRLIDDIKWVEKLLLESPKMEIQIRPDTHYGSALRAGKRISETSQSNAPELSKFLATAIPIIEKAATDEWQRQLKDYSDRCLRELNTLGCAYGSENQISKEQKKRMAIKKKLNLTCIRLLRKVTK